MSGRRWWSGWGSALIIITWLMYRYYGDTKSAEEYFDNMIHWMQFLQTGMEKGIVEGEGTDKDCLGEWSTPGEILIPPRFVNTFFYAYNAKLMTELAEVLGRSADAEYFRISIMKQCLALETSFMILKMVGTVLGHRERKHLRISWVLSEKENFAK